MTGRFGLSTVLVTLAVCGGQRGHGGGMELTYHRSGEAVEPVLSEVCLARIPEIVRELVAGAEPLRLLVSEERIEEIRREEAVEVLFPEPRRLPSASGREIAVRRVLVPLSGESWIGGADRPFVTIFLGDEGYRSGPVMNPAGRPLALELRNCASGE